MRQSDRLERSQRRFLKDFPWLWRLEHKTWSFGGEDMRACTVKPGNVAEREFIDFLLSNSCSSVQILVHVVTGSSRSIQAVFPIKSTTSDDYWVRKIAVQLSHEYGSTGLSEITVAHIAVVDETSGSIMVFRAPKKAEKKSLGPLIALYYLKCGLK